MRLVLFFLELELGSVELLVLCLSHGMVADGFLTHSATCHAGLSFSCTGLFQSPQSCPSHSKVPKVVLPVWEMIPKLLWD